MNDLERLGWACGTDKITHHGYHAHFERFLEGIRHKAGAMLEIGIERLHSVNLWLQYCPNMFVYGIDIKVGFDEPRCKVFRADQSRLEDLVGVRSQIDRPVWFVVDDGSHVPQHQLSTFDFFFRELLQPGGVYIVEDIEVSYWNKDQIYGYPTEYGYKHPDSFIERAKPLLDTVNWEFLNADARASSAREAKLSAETLSMISMVSFARNCVIFVKKTDAEMREHHRPYRFKSKID